MGAFTPTISPTTMKVMGFYYPTNSSRNNSGWKNRGSEWTPSDKYIVLTCPNSSKTQLKTLDYKDSLSYFFPRTLKSKVRHIYQVPKL